MASSIFLLATAIALYYSKASGQYLGAAPGSLSFGQLGGRYSYNPEPLWGSIAPYNPGSAFGSSNTFGAGASLPYLPTITVPPRINVIRNFNQFDNGGYSESAGLQLGPTWAKVSQTHDAKGFVGPKMVSAGADVLSKNGNGVSGSVDVFPGIGGSGKLKGVVGIIDNPEHKVNAYVQHDRFLDKNLKPIGPETNSAGINYSNKDSGASAFLTTSQTNGAPAVTSLGGSIPIVKSDDVRVSATGQTTAGHGRKPDHQVGVEVSASF